MALFSRSFWRFPTRSGLWLNAPGLAIATALITACASLMGPRTVEISREELLAKMGKRFPATQHVMQLLDVTAAMPTLDLQADRNRVLATVDLTAQERVMNQQYTGKVGLSFGLRYEPKDLTIRLTEPKIEQLRVDGLPAIYQRALTNMGTKVVEDQLQDFPVHRFKPEDLREADRFGYEVKDIVVTTTGLAVHLSPRR